MIAEHNVRMGGLDKVTKDPAFTLRTNLRFGRTLNRRRNVVPGTVSHRKEGDLSDESWLSHFQIKKSNRLGNRRLLPLVRGAFNNAPLVNQMASRPLFYDNISAHLAVRHSRILNIYDQRIIVDSSGGRLGKRRLHRDPAPQKISTGWL